MFDFNSLLHFSHAYCVAICAALVPLNLLATILTIVLTGLRRPSAEVLKVSGVAIAFAGMMVLHVLTWFAVGVVMVPTYVLLTLGTVCFAVNAWAILHPSSLQRLLNRLTEAAKQSFPALG
ncbi:hypothetical protein JOY44_17660 [Phormidium sp. CLA17]|uniref:hypothetical protein n=1 Tax=Leptolyngbya sp. Cla-17 TaxID=2803751 RepID=UPI0014911BD2|nr:hypothetical protein [Leptolyngbya sp. Cla-17]MBM0743416.1 hypothetical protein [Leptolyngbya sp. Cla-17]